jgi:hypothetical protein
MDLVVTQSGLTPEKPWRSLLGISTPSPLEYDEWKVKADDLVSAARKQFYYLGDVESRTSKGTHHPHWNALIDEFNEIQARAEELPGLIGLLFDPTDPGLSHKNEVNDAVAVAVDAACFIEKVDLAIDAYGIEVPKPGVTPTAPALPPDKEGIGVLGFIGALTIAGGVLYGVVKYTQKDRAAPAA